ncbi:MAG: succinate dehydrogenase, cytochrome b556 subunit [Alphaproteobacteria bacterium CG_4_9_14_3_um_filter_47_13]|nr:MAG: succinate dehydrogenase, cytochrome b556 subunit [Alphaproteobacteria bacterium CG_4_9_14_3_um_filter_47_13]
MSDAKKINPRPLSPHLQVYRPQLTSVMSILHRATGFSMAVGTMMIVWMLVAAASGVEAYDTFQWFVGTVIGKLMIFGWSAAAFYHLCNGVRHLFWDMGYLFKIENAYKAGYLVLAAAALLLALFWWLLCGGAA